MFSYLSTKLKPYISLGTTNRINPEPKNVSSVADWATTRSEVQRDNAINRIEKKVSNLSLRDKFKNMIGRNKTHDTEIIKLQGQKKILENFNKHKKIDIPK